MPKRGVPDSSGRFRMSSVRGTRHSEKAQPDRSRFLARTALHANKRLELGAPKYLPTATLRWTGRGLRISLVLLSRHAKVLRCHGIREEDRLPHRPGTDRKSTR